MQFHHKNKVRPWPTGVAPGIIRRGAESYDEGAKIWFSGYYKCQKSPKKSLFVFRRGTSMLRRGGYSPLALHWRHPCWPNDSIFHSIVSSTFQLKVERWLSVVEHVWPNDSIFRSTFLLTVQQLMPRCVYQLKIFTITNICRQMRRYCACFHSTSSAWWANGSIFTQQEFFCSIF